MAIQLYVSIVEKIRCQIPHASVFDLTDKAEKTDQLRVKLHMAASCLTTSLLRTANGRMATAITTKTAQMTQAD
jgi:hypothetical protein